MFDGILSPSWTVAFAIALSAILFFIKFLIAREPKFDDIVIALAEIPAELSAVCISLLIASFKFAPNWKDPAMQIIVVGAVFIFNVVIFRIVERHRRNLTASVWRVSPLIATSAALCAMLCFNSVSLIYKAGGG